MQFLGLYLHTPFCEHKCGYCDFNSWAETDEKIQWEWLSGIKKELLFWKKSFQGIAYQVDTVFFGGGTPSLLSTEVLDDLFNFLEESFVFHEELEFTVECNPESLSYEKLCFFKKQKVNRLSVGIQSFQNKFLALLERKANRQKNLEVLQIIDEHWAGEYSFDLIFGIPGQSLSDWEEDLNCALSFSSNHLSAYQLTLSTARSKNWKQLSEDELFPYAEKARNYLSRAFFEQYEVSNYARNQKRSRHNLKYWNLDSFLGLGPGAYSLLKGGFAQALDKSYGSFGFHYKSPASFQRWIQVNADVKFIKAQLEQRSESIHMQETVIQGLRKKEGFDIELLKGRSEEVHLLQKKHPKLFKGNSKKLLCTDYGFYVLDYSTRQALEFLT